VRWHELKCGREGSDELVHQLLAAALAHEIKHFLGDDQATPGWRSGEGRSPSPEN